MAARDPQPSWLLALRMVVIASALGASLVYVANAVALVGYPWDWSPDEGLTLDYARRILEDRGRLYAMNAVPLPLAYGPLLPLLLAPIVAHWSAPFAAARVVALAWTGLGAVAVYGLVRRRGTPLLGLASGALYLAPLDVSFWHMLIRADGLMTALWLAAALPLLPRRIERGADRLSSGRAAVGTILLLAAILTKPTAVIHGLPLVLGWWLVDRKSALRLAVALGGAGLATLGLLQWATSGGFLWVNRLYELHPSVPWQSLVIPLMMLQKVWPIAMLALAGGWRAERLGLRPWRDSSLLLVAGGLLIIPATAKFGASWNYLLPLMAAIVVFSGRVWSEPSPAIERSPTPALGALATAALALALATSRTFPLPSAEDEKTARAFYSFVRTFTSEVGGPILVSRPEYAYFQSRQSVEVEGSGFPLLYAQRVAGTEKVLERVQHETYTLVAWTWPFPAEIEETVERNYRHVGECTLGWYFTHLDVHLFTRRDVDPHFLPPPGTRCHGALPPAP